ncbi:MAG: Gfo/Idh/MocA family protein [Haloarculaceae archaeon]
MQFGVISTANIGVDSVIPAIQRSDHEVAAIASRDGERAQAVADDLGIPRAYDSYGSLLDDDGIDAVYNPLPNALHAEWTRRAADAGLHVLCEKPLAVDAPEAADLFDYCEDRGVTLMEAFMYRFHPRTRRAATVVSEELADVRSVTATFKFPLYGRPDDVRLDPDLAGGSLMDVGCYAVSAARLFLGEPDSAYGSTTDTRDCGVDTELAAVLEYDDGAVARVASGFDTQLVEGYRVDATNGWLKAERAFGPDPDESVSITYSVDGRQVTETFDPVDHYRLEVEHFAECVTSGSTPRIDRAETLGNMAAIDAIYESAERGESVDVAVPE